MSTELQIAVLGIVGTLAGTVLGWVLNSLSQKGKLKVFVKKWEEVYQKPDKLGGFEKCNSNEAEYYNYNLSLDIYNSSRETRIMRNIQVVFMDRKSLLFSSVPMDDATKRFSHPLVHYDEISVVNIPAKSVVAVEMHAGLNKSCEEWGYFSKANRVTLVYIDEKNKKKTVEICKKR